MSVRKHFGKQKVLKNKKYTEIMCTDFKMVGEIIEFF